MICTYTHIIDIVLQFYFFIILVEIRFGMRRLNVLNDPDVEKMAVESRQNLVKEFQEKHADLRDRVSRVPIDLAGKIADKLKCPLQIAMVAYLIDLDGILSIREAVNLLMQEIHRRNTVGSNIPNIPGNVQEFAIDEGRWLEYLYGKYSSQLELRVREIANIETAMEEDDIPVEKAMLVLSARTKIAETFIAPVIQTWLNEHVQSTHEDVLIALGIAVTEWSDSTIRGKLISLKRRAQAFYRYLQRIIMEGSSESSAMGSYIAKINAIVDGFDADFNEMSLLTLSHFILHIAPKPLGTRGDRSSYVDVGSSMSRGGKLEPEMITPYDFLERDVRLAKRRRKDDRAKYLHEKIARVLRVLRYQGTSSRDNLERCIDEISTRLQIDGIDKESIIDKMEASLSASRAENQDETATSLLYDFIITHVYGDT